MSKNIFEIWKENGERVPFAVRRDNWGPEFYAVVEEIEIRKWPYGIARGYSTRNGYRNGHFALDPEWRKKHEISCAGCYQWTLVENATIDKALVTHTNDSLLDSDSIITFGKYCGLTLENVFKKDPNYIKWMIVNIEKIIINPDTLAAWANSVNNTPITPDIIDMNILKYQKQANKIQV